MTFCPLRLQVAALESSPLPVDLSLIKTHCAIDGDDFDTVLQTYLLAAISWAEGAMHRTIYSRSHRWVLQDFPCDVRQEIRLPRGKTQSVESVQYVTAAGSVTTLAGSSSSPAGTAFQEDLTGDDGGIILPAFGESWPSVDCDAAAPVVINFTAGWLASEVPQDVVHALLFAVSDAFENRGTADMTAGENFSVRDTLLSAYKLARFY